MAHAMWKTKRHFVHIYERAEVFDPANNAVTTAGGGIDAVLHELGREMRVFFTRFVCTGIDESLFRRNSRQHQLAEESQRHSVHMHMPMIAFFSIIMNHRFVAATHGAVSSTARIIMVLREHSREGEIA